MVLTRKIRQFSKIFSCSLVFAALVLAAPASHAYNRLDAIQALQSVQSNWQGAEVDVWINNLRGDSDPGIMIGEIVSFSVESSVPGYFLLTLVDAKGETTLIAGDAGDPASRNLDFPPKDSAELLEQGPPVGDQSVFVFVSDTEFMLQELGVTADERVVTLPKEIASLEKMASILNRHGSSGMLALAPRYTYFVDSPDNKISTRGLKRAMKKQMVQMEKPEPSSPPVVVASKEPDPKPAVKQPEPVAKQSEPVATASVVKEPETIGTATATASSALSLDIKFQTNSAELGDEGVAQLDVVGSVLISLLEANALPKISLEGHTDDTGAAEYNMKLSDKRAKSARAYLISAFGLPADSIEAYGMGESSPMVKNRDSASRALNRRVELRVLR